LEAFVSETPSERHNRVAPDLVRKLVLEAEDENDAFVMLETVILGVMLFYRPNPRHAGEYLDSMTTAVIDRMKP
jgi:hypothetical protein